MKAIDEPLWFYLSKIKTFEFNAINAKNSKTDWNGHGSGNVLVTTYQDGWLFTEQGYYLTSHHKKIKTNNKLHFQHNELDLKISHLRYQKPVSLVELRNANNGYWLTINPYLCGQDNYTAELMLTPKGFILNWNIIGPHKNERLNYQYRF